ncbi:MAG: hypothetical protein K2X61_09220 [Caulobacteraceae bacterium]|nr:hypothetical protein [Alphaproteobacteria bacterium]MBX9708097.1 hypothetical protein [Caulobacteraceae bacterium]MBU1525878.1 hypothetical protein [Alphaproteobacteria bacterium]MBU2117225.1 hypothetical protein [Alphaproteobacteria bacterium]MBU2350447.1 hypothetical protein [Alphaproteobacteria bacterium]
MPRVFRLFCICFSVALLAALNAHAVAETQHSFGHGAGWPPVSLTSVDDDHGIHVHVAPAEAPDEDPETDGEQQPIGHHHHNGGDPHAAVPTLSRAPVHVLALAADPLTPGADHALTGWDREGPEDPPKRTLTVI